MTRFKLTASLLAASAFALLAACQQSAPSATPAAPDAAQATTTDDRDAEEPSAEDAIATALAKAASTSGRGQPAMWKLADEDTTLYLFGTVHLLKPETEWRSDKFDAAFSAADRLVTEVDTDSPEALLKIQSLMAKRGLLQDGQTLTGLLDDRQEAELSRALKTIGVPISTLENFQPWFAGLNMSLLQIQQSGYSPDSGVETILTSEARRTGKTIGYLETPEQQLNALSGGTLEEQIEGLVFTAETFDFGPDILDALVEEWADGDLAGLGVIIADPDSVGGEAAYKRLLIDRNANWVPQIQAMLDTPGTQMIAVGAAHLAGPNSVVKMLRSEGVTVEPY